MRTIWAMVFCLWVAVPSFSDELENYTDKALFEQYGLFDGIYFQEKGSSEKLKYNLIGGPSPELKAKLDLFPVSRGFEQRINERLLWGNLLYWGCLALIPADIAFLSSYGNRMPVGNALGIYFSVSGVAIVGAIAATGILYDAKNAVNEAVWEYNRGVVFGYQ